ncbi:hypothetical protein TanjilG_19294 [Lupinus angustifolius]|uniref:Thioredoxin domain-containing protein n=1 Tax=Lupinus angustifolius TaxID=3871 RepID=A0A1J7IYZ2_LUPAN|nr:PREDICTED: 1-Cys peroxiredoxin-like [Lupinus angustifolius]OIW18062.1 hypothetical protein TanjilG_19294 [Lupinus angustifolius]
MPGLTMGDTIPNLEVESTNGKINLHHFCNDSWTILFSHPGDFTPVCTTELGQMAKYCSEFYQRGVKLLGLSCDDLESHNEWIRDIEAYTVSFSHFTLVVLLYGPYCELFKYINHFYVCNKYKFV